MSERVLEYREDECTLLVRDELDSYEVFDVTASEYAELMEAADPWGRLASLRSRHEHRDRWNGLASVLEEVRDILLIEGPITVNAVGLDGDTPLHVACVWGHLGAVQILLEHGANPNAVGDLSATPLYNAVSFGWARCAHALLAAGADPDAENELGTTPRRRAERASPRMQALFLVAR